MDVQKTRDGTVTVNRNETARKPLGCLMMVLHAHLPFVRHPEHDQAFEESWLFEAMAECYIPLLMMMDRLDADQVFWRLTMTITPTLAAMLEDPLLQDRFVRYLQNLEVLAEREVERTQWEPDYHSLARFYKERFQSVREYYFGVHGNLLREFKKRFDRGNLELIACTATHAFLPLLHHNRDSVQAQLRVGVEEFFRHFGRNPRGIWLPECGYFPGLESDLEKYGLEYFFLDTHGVVFSEPRPRYGIYAPIACSNSKVFALGRDSECSKQVWSALEGYPGDSDYREFHSDIGFDLDLEYLKRHLHPLGIRSMTGIKYKKVTGTSGGKLPYKREVALGKARIHAKHFVDAREKQAAWLADAMDGLPALFVAPYDAELFGHWWFEGPEWLEYVIRECGQRQGRLLLMHYPDYSRKYKEMQRASLPYSSWGEKGYAETWLDPSNDWIYFHLYECGLQVSEVCKVHGNSDELTRRALRQLMRELLLAQSSDWPFILKAGTVSAYATQRIEEHVLNILAMVSQIRNGQVDEKVVIALEKKNNLFPHIDLEKMIGDSQGF